MKHTGFAGIQLLMFVIVGLLVVFGGYLIMQQSDFVEQFLPGDPSVAVTPTPEPELVSGTVVIEASAGTLTNLGLYEGTFTYLQESSRGFEAYLGEKDAQVSLPFTIEETGPYEFWFYTSDDGVHADGSRNVMVSIDQVPRLQYQHKSQDTKGMVWQKLGNFQLAVGSHTLEVTKSESTSAAFSFTRIKLVPVANGDPDTTR